MVATSNRLLAVYCELREGLKYHDLLKNCKKVGEFLSEPDYFLMKNLTLNSGIALKKGNRPVVFEVYEVSVLTMSKISKHKGYYLINYKHNLNDKILIETPYGKAVTFIDKNTELKKENIIKDYDYVDYANYTNLLTSK